MQSGFLKKEFNIYSVLLEKFGKIKYNDYIFNDECLDDNSLSENFNLNEAIDADYLNFEDSLIESEDSNYSDNSDSDSENLVKPNLFYNDIEINSILGEMKNDDFLSLNENINSNYVYFEDLIEKDFLPSPDTKDLKFDFKTDRLKLFKTNRDILSFFIKKKIKNKTKFNKIIKNLIKKPLYDFIMHFEFSLKNVLLRSQFFFNENDINFFVKNNYILKNNKFVSNLNNFLTVGDRISIKFNKFYFFYYRSVLNGIYKNMSRYANYIWLMDQSLHNENKQKKTHIPRWIFNLIYFREDIPNFLEIDFLTMHLIILYKPLLSELDWTKVKFLNYYHRRLYNWRAII